MDAPSPFVPQPRVLHVSPVTQPQIVGWSVLASLWFLGSLGAGLHGAFPQSVRTALATLAGLTALVLIVWLGIFAATVRCPVPMLPPNPAGASVPWRQ